MQPVRLDLQAFGSYGGLLEIDFVRLGAHGIFSITGPTGAGKTTIFDALCYALYGEVPGSRNVINVRSDFANDDTETLVRFEFLIRGQRWSLERAPAWTRSRRRGTGVTTKPARVVLRCEDGSEAPLTKTREVISRVESLIGLTAEQFQQAVLLPQGRFEAVLKAPTADRSQLLRRLFPVDIYGRITQKLSDEASARHMALDSKRAEIVVTDAHAKQQLMEAAGLINASTDPIREFEDDSTFEATDLNQISSRLETHVNEAQANEAAALAASNEAQRVLEAATASATAYDQWVADVAAAEIFDLEEVSDAASDAHLDLRAMVATQINVINTWERATSSVLLLRESIGARVELLVDAGTDKDSVSLDDRVAVRALHEDLKRLLTSMEAASVDLLQLSIEEASLEDLTTNAAESAKLFQHLHEVEQVDIAASEQLELLASTREGLGVEVSRLGERLRDLSVERDRGTALAQIHERLGSARLRVRVAEQSVASAENYGAELHQTWRASIAAVVAEALVEGEPCPTCGSVWHPSPATVTGDGVSDQDLTQSQESIRTARHEHTESVTVVASLEGQLLGSGPAVDIASIVQDIVDVSEQLNQSNIELDGANRAAQTLLELRQRRSERVESLAQATTAAAVDAARLDERSGALGVRRATFIESHGEPVDFEAALAEQTCRRDLLKSQEEELDERDRLVEHQRASEVSLAALIVAAHVVSPTELRPLDIERDELARLRRDIAERAATRATVLERIREAQRSSITAARPDIEDLTETARAAREHHTFEVERRTALTIHASAFARDVETLRRDREIEIQFLVAAEESDTLARLCAGNTAGRDRSRVSLQDWVLAVYLKDVLAHANLRLERMTNGRYSLQVSPEDGDGRGRHGLDIEVFDTFTGCPRPAAAMSGGETFQCALALALGLSDVIAAGSNYELGALFIDEGFDTLDSGALEEVLAVLEGLNVGGRMVGVISHVEDLQRALPQGITVQITRAGSSAELHYPDE